MHSSFTTDAFIIKTTPRNERGLIVTMYTRDFGLLRARVDGVRSPRSRLRGHLQPLSVGKVRLIRGREWRIATIISDRNIFFEASSARGVAHSFARILHVLPRLIHGEEPNEHIFETLQTTADAMFLPRTVPEQVEAISMLRILSALGYVAEDEVTSPFLKDASSAYTVGDLSWKKLVPRINEALVASHL